MTPGTYLCLFLMGIVLLFPSQSHECIEYAILHLRIMDLNRRLKRQQWKLYKQLQRDHRERGWPELPPFEFVPVQHRGKK